MKLAIVGSSTDAYVNPVFDPQGRSVGNVNAIDAVDAKYAAP